MTRSQIKNSRICRTCFHPIRSGKFVQLHDVCSVPEPETVQEMLSTVVPEIDLKSVVDPVICRSCLTMLQTSYKFRKICVANETRLVEQMQIAEMKSVKLNYIGDGENNPVVKCEEDLQTETNESLCPLPLDTVKSVEDIKNYYKESGFDASIEIIELKTEENCLEPADEDKMDGDCLSEKKPQIDPLHETCTEIDVELESSECNQQNQGAGDQKTIVSDLVEVKDEPTNNISHEIKSSARKDLKLNASSKNQQNDEPTRVRRQRKFFCSTTSFSKHNKVQLKCEECNLTFYKSYFYCKHMIATHNMSFPKCEKCDKSFHNARLLKRHMYRHLPAKKRNPLGDFLCDVCGKHFGRYSSFRAHQSTHEKKKCGRVKCEMCGKMVSGQYGLALHRRSHVACKEFMCEMCGAQFKCRAAFRKHRGKHLGTYIKKHRCPVCDKPFDNRSRLNLHLLTHNGAKPHICQVCNRGFSLLPNLKRHLRKHTGEKPYVCNVCERRFTRITGLKEHICGPKKEECNVCGKSFQLKETLERHVRRLHTAKEVKKRHLACEICGRTFAQACNMKRHMLVHSTERQFACEMCQKRFKTKYEFIVHTRRHTGEKPYKCQFCEMCFVESGEKGRHERKHLQVGVGSTRKKVKQAVNVM